MTRRPTFGTKAIAALRIEFKNAPPCGCDAQPSRAEIAQLAANFAAIGERAQALADALAEPQGPLALDAAEKAIRWLSRGREHTPPLVKFRDGGSQYTLKDPDSIYIARGQSDRDTVRSVGHETEHWRCPWDASEAPANAAGDYVMRRYFQSWSD